MRFCTHCGVSASPAKDATEYQCTSCNAFTYFNPLPVAVALIPVQTDEGLKLLGTRRGIQPGYGELALPGGFMSKGEDWRQAAAREVFEELNFTITEWDALKVFAVHSTPDGSMVLVFALSQNVLDGNTLLPFLPNEETLERVLLSKGDTVCFPFHQLVLDQFFDNPDGYLRG